MGVKEKGASGAVDETPEEIVDENESETSGTDDKKTVSRSTYQKTLAAEKAAKERARLAEERAAKLEQEKLAAQGDKDGEIKNLQSRLSQSEKEKSSLQKAVIRKALNEQVRAAAAKAGCLKPEGAIKLVDMASLGDVDADTLEADQELVDAAIADLKTEYPTLFSKKGPSVNGQPPKGGKIDDGEPNTTTADLKKKSTADLWKEYGKAKS